MLIIIDNTDYVNVCIVYIIKFYVMAHEWVVLSLFNWI